MRSDLSQNLFHWVKGDSEQEAYGILLEIIRTGQLLGGTGEIRGGYECICFTEAPRELFFKINSRYTAFGVMLGKSAVFDLGGRPVIYQSEEEFNLLDESIKWKHVRYEPTATPAIDFTWEREWRLPMKKLDLSLEETTVIVPNEKWKKRLYEDFESEEIQLSDYTNAMLGGYFIAPRDFPYKCIGFISS